MLKQILDIKAVRLIAAASTEEYAGKIGSIPLFSRLFQKIDLPELPLNDIVQIMRIRVEDFRRYHQVTIDIEGICRHPIRSGCSSGIACSLTRRLSCWIGPARTRASNPGRPGRDSPACGRVGLPENCGGFARSGDFYHLGNPSGKTEDPGSHRKSADHRPAGGDRKAGAEDRAVYDRPEDEEGRPDGVFLFVGPTGVGKTETARALAEVLLGSEDKLLRIDMSEYMEEFTVLPFDRRGARLRRL